MPLDLASGPKPPPTRTRRPATGAKAVEEKTASTLEATRRESLESLFQIGAAVAMATSNHADAAACHRHGPGIAKEAAPLGSRYEQFGKMLDWIGQVGPFAGLLAATLPFALQIAANHGRVPYAAVAQFGVVEPQVLTMQVQAELAQRAAQEMREQAEARRAAQAAMDEITRIQEEDKPPAAHAKTESAA